MATVIVRIYTSGGFVIAADGLTTETKPNGEIKAKGETVQKIFPTAPLSGPMAFALSGHIEASNSQKPYDPPVDWRERAVEVAKNLESVRIKKSDRYIMIFCRGMSDWVKEKDYWLEGDAQPENTRLMTVGYFKGKPIWNAAEIEYDCPNKRTSIGLTEVRPVTPGISDFQAGEVLEAIKRGDPFFIQYRTPEFIRLVEGNDVSLGEAQDIARNFIKACSSQEAKKLYENCRKIGGHIHMATITLDRGFEWIDPPIRMPSAEQNTPARTMKTRN